MTSTRRPHLQRTWHDPETGAACYVVLDQLRHGVASGGVRMRAGCSLDEMAALARTMSLKEALLYRPDDQYRPYGGGKGGIDYDPSAPGAADVLRRYVAAVRPLLDECWATGADLGVRQRDLDEAAAEVGLPSTIQAVLGHVPDGPQEGLLRLGKAFAQKVDGMGLGEVVGGYGVARAVETAVRHCGEDPSDCTVALQGFGEIGGAAARFLAARGVRVVAVADELGTVVNRGGLDVEHLLRHRSVHGVLDRACLRPGDLESPPSAWLDAGADIVVTAAIPYAIDDRNQRAVAARYVIEGANVSLTSGAEKVLTARGVTIVPDFVANCGTNAWWWWTLFGDVAPTVEAAFARLAVVIPELVERVLSDADRDAVTARRAAARIAAANMALLDGAGAT